MVIGALLLAAGITTSAGSLAQADPSVNVHPVAQLVASDGFAGEGFGHDVDIDGDVMVVGAIGAAYVFTRSNGQWSETAKLTVLNAPSGLAVNRLDHGQSRYVPVEGQDILLDREGVVYGGFGRAVAVDGDVIVVGAYEAAHVFISDEGEWTKTAKLTGPDDLSDLGPLGENTSTTGMGSTLGFLEGGFGQSVAVDKDTIVVGASGRITMPSTGEESSPQLEEHPTAAYVFTRTDGEWSQATKLTAPDGVGSEWFGRSVAVSGNVVAVGGTAVVHVFERTVDVWSEMSMLTNSDGAIGYGFGQSVALDGAKVAAGASGAAYAIELFSHSWTGERLTPPSGPGGGIFGWDVDIDGDTVVLAPLEIPAVAGTNPLPSYVFEFARSESRHNLAAALISVDAGWKTQSVAVEGDTVAVGAHLASYERGEDNIWRNFHQAPGAVRLFDLSSVAQGAIAADCPTVLSSPGGAVSGHRLVASDGALQDRFGGSLALDGGVLAVGASGAVYVFAQTDGDWVETAKLTIPGDRGFGGSLALDGGVLAVGASGAVYVFAQTDGDWVETAKLTIPDEELLGSWVALDGDVIVAGAAGAVYVFERYEEGWSSERLVPSGGLADGLFNWNGDIDDDVIVVAGRWLLHVFVRAGHNWSEAVQLLPFDHAVGFGEEIAIDGDVIVVGTYGFVFASPPAPSRAADVYMKPLSGWTDATLPTGLMVTAGIPGDKFGVSAGMDGDVIALGVAGGRPIPCDAQESVYVYAKPPSGWADAVLVTRIQASDVGIPPDSQYGYFGGSVALDEGWLAVGASSVAVGLNPGQGAVYVFDLTDVTAPHDLVSASSTAAAESSTSLAAPTPADQTVVMDGGGESSTPSAALGETDQKSSGGVRRVYWILLAVAGLVLISAALARYRRNTRVVVADDEF